MNSDFFGIMFVSGFFIISILIVKIKKMSLKKWFTNFL